MTIDFFSTFVPIWTIDRLGRRKLMLFAVVGQGCCMAILAGTVHDGSTSAGIVATVMLFLFNFFFAVGLLAIAWLLPAEYTPLAIRTKAAALATASNWIFTFVSHPLKSHRKTEQDHRIMTDSLIVGG